MSVEYINTDGMHKSPVFSQGIILPANARLLLIGGQNGVDEKGEIVGKGDVVAQTRPLRKREDMPDFVREALDERGLRAAYDARPPYQRNDYLLWINKVKREDTKQKHLAQMLDELEAGGLYMGMKWSG